MDRALSVAEKLAAMMIDARRDADSRDWERLTTEHAELTACIGDIDALIPEDCRSAKAEKLANVRDSVGLLAQRVEQTRKDNEPLRELFRELGLGMCCSDTMESECQKLRRLIAPSAYGTGAWAWQQMQRGPEVWVCRRELPVTSRYHMKHPGLIENAIGSQFNGVEPMVLEQMWPGATDWELCDTPKQADGSGPTREQSNGWMESAYGPHKWVTTVETDKLLRLCWTAAREGMVEQVIVDDININREQLLARAQQAEARVRELERGDDVVALAAVLFPGTNDYRGSMNAIRDGVAQLRADLTSWEQWSIESLEIRGLHCVKDTPGVNRGFIAGHLNTMQALEKQWLAVCEELGAVYETDSGNFHGTTKDVVGAIARLKADVDRLRADLAAAREEMKRYSDSVESQASALAALGAVVAVPGHHTFDGWLTRVREEVTRLDTENTQLQSDIAALRGEEWTPEWCSETFELVRRDDQDVLAWEDYDDDDQAHLLRFANACRVRPGVNAGESAPPQSIELPPIPAQRGRKLTDGEQTRLHQLCINWRDRGGRVADVSSFVESLLAPAPELQNVTGAIGPLSPDQVGELYGHDWGLLAQFDPLGTIQSRIVSLVNRVRSGFAPAPTPPPSELPTEEEVCEVASSWFERPIKSFGCIEGYLGDYAEDWKWAVALAFRLARRGYVPAGELERVQRDTVDGMKLMGDVMATLGQLSDEKPVDCAKRLTAELTTLRARVVLPAAVLSKATGANQ